MAAYIQNCIETLYMVYQNYNQVHQFYQVTFVALTWVVYMEQ